MASRNATPRASRLAAELERLSKGELIDLIQRLQNSLSEEEIVGLVLQLKGRSTGDTEVLPRPDAVRPFDMPWEVDRYVTLPRASEVGGVSKLSVPWRIALVSFDLAHPIIGLEIWDDVVVGRAEGDFKPDLDLTDLKAGKYGVSRRHALLHPTNDALQVEDLGSTNGTRKNNELLRPNERYVLENGEVLAFGRLQFQLRIVDVSH